MVLPDSVPMSQPAGITDTGAAGPGTELTVRLYLAGRDPSAEASFAAAVSTPGSGVYGKFVSPARFASLFGPTRAQVAAVTGWAGGVPELGGHPGAEHDADAGLAEDDLSVRVPAKTIRWGWVSRRSCHRSSSSRAPRR
jgi:hypothetical protein